MTSYPESIQTFPQMQNMEATDGDYIKEYQVAIQSGDISAAQIALAKISNGNNKLLTANYLNTINDTVIALQNEFAKRYNPSITVSANAPVNPETKDYWWQVV